MSTFLGAFDKTGYSARKTAPASKVLVLQLNPNVSHIPADLTGLLIPQGIFPLSAVITDTPLLLKSPCENTIRRDTGTNL
ncbi:hypothetical protein [Acidihalobacter ferrooxydans]|uniref:hypothetical protein n=1 Tax=Acidihalobacter ferrooxydans TaxID=1765967 RepID=UPI0012EC8BBB|nr:hypothetical protein [Acidihalobacter ferrooxydans]